MLAIGTHNFDKQLTVVSGAHYPGPSSPIQALRVNPFRWKVFYRNSFREKMRKSKNQSTNQSTTQLSHANLHVLFCVLKNRWQQWRKACGEIYRSHETMYFRGKAYSKNNSLLRKGWLKSTTHMEAPGNLASVYQIRLPCFPVWGIGCWLKLEWASIG